MEMGQLEAYLSSQGADFLIIKQHSPIRTLRDAGQYYDLGCAAMALVVEAAGELLLLIASAKRGRLDFKGLGETLGLKGLRLADKIRAQAGTGCRMGAVPLVGLNLPCLFDSRLLFCRYIYGGSGDEWHTLKIAPQDVRRLNRTVRDFD